MSPRPSRPGATSSTGGSIAVFRMIVISFALGIAGFTAVALFIGPLGEGDSMPFPFQWIVLVYGVVAIPLALILRPILDRRVASRRDAAIEQIKMGLMPTELGASTIVPAALAESVGLFGSVGLLITGNTLLLAAPIVSVAVILLMWPSESRLLERVESAGRA